MKSKLITLLAALMIVSLGLPMAPAPAQEVNNPLEAPDRYCAAPVCAGYGEADATWHVGAGAGQYSNKNPDNVINSVSGGDVDPHGHSIAQQDSYGVQSRLSYRAIVVEDAEGDQVAFVKSDSYLAQDYLSRRVGQILLQNDSKIAYEEIFHMASHNHSSPYYMTPSPGPWIFQDAFDIRAFEYHARQMAKAILAAEDAAVPARMGATTVEHKLFKGMIQRKGISDDGTPRGYPEDFGDFGLSVIRFDDISDPAQPKPLATMINFGQHPEGLDNHDLITGDFVASLERFVERATGAPLVFGQGDVGSAEAGPGHPEQVAAMGFPARWSHAGHAQAERGGFLLARDVVEGWQQIADPAASPLVRFSSEFDVEAGSAFVAGPYSHPYPSVNACRTETTVEGQPGVGTAADCTRGPHADDAARPIKEGSDEVWTPIEEGTGHGQENPLPSETDKSLWEKLKEAGVPIPDNYDTPSYFALEENTRLHLQAFKMGEVILASCACEAQVDLILNFETRANEQQGDIWDGFDWTEPFTNPSNDEARNAAMLCDKDPQSGDYSCRRNPDYGRDRAVLEGFSSTDYEFRRMKAQIHNDAAGWDDPQNTHRAISEPYEPAEILGNFTKEELSPEAGYKLAIGVGHGGDYNGYTISYREYQSWDDYRKALTSYGAHTADYMVTRMVQLAAKVNGVPQPELELDVMRGLPDEARQLAMSAALGATSMAAWEAWQKSLPVDKGPVPAAIEQPEDIDRFDAAAFRWRGGSNAVDNPTVIVQRCPDPGTCDDDDWITFADQSGEVQTKVEFPNGANAFADTYSENQEWIWTANFEAFNALPADIGSTPAGEYRFVVDGMYRAQSAFDQGYEVASEPFTVSPWDGISVGDLTLAEDGSVSFDVAPIQYPTSYEAQSEKTDFRYIQTSGKTHGGDDVIKSDELGRPFCTTCTFRPWAQSGEVQTATVTVERADGSTETVEATKGADGRWHADTELYEGDHAYVSSGGVVDNYGESNASATGAVTGTRARPTPTPTDTSSATPTDTTTPTEDPGPATSELVFTDRSAEAGEYTDEALIEVRLTGRNGPLGGEEVMFEMVGADGSSAWTATTDADGIAGDSILLNRLPGSYQLTARFQGDELQLGTATTTGFVIERDRPLLDLTAKRRTNKKHGTFVEKLEARLTDDDGKPLAKRSLQFFADGDPFRTTSTDKKGRATVSVPGDLRDASTFEVRFGGNEFLTPASAHVDN